MIDFDKLAERRGALHPRVSLANCTPCWTRKRQTVWGVTLDGKYHRKPHCRTIEGALNKAETLSRDLQERQYV